MASGKDFPLEVACNKFLCNLPLGETSENQIDMKILSAAAIVMGAMVLTNCAKAPEAVEPTKFDHQPYLRLSCSTLRKKEAEGTIAVNSLSAKQKAAADNDALGVFLLGLPLASMSGNDPEAQLSIAKGQLDAVKLAKAEKGCK